MESYTLAEELSRLNKQVRSTKSTKSSYTLRERARKMEQTAERIAAAAFDLHASIGPSNTTISAIAKNAGVQRLTVYRHYPDELSLFQACVRHGLDKLPMPDPEKWNKETEPSKRLRNGLLEMYEYYERSKPVWTNILPDIARIPALYEANAITFEKFGDIFQSLVGGWRVRGRPRKKLEAAVWLAIQFPTWQTLALRGLTNVEAAELMVCLAQRCVGTG